MENKRRKRYLLAIYLIVASLAIILLLIGINYSEDTWKSIFLNLSTELLGVVLVFFLVNYLFLVDDWSLSEQIKRLLDRLQLAERPSARDFFQKPHNIEQYILNANKINLCGVTLTSFINKQLSNLRERLFEGAQIRLLIVNPNSIALKMATLRSEDTEDIDYYKKRIDATFKDIEYLHRSLTEYQANNKSKSGSFSVKLLSFAPSFGISIFDISHSNKITFVGIYPHHIGYGSPPMFSLTPQRDSEWYNYFSNQFEAMWRIATPWEYKKDLKDGNNLLLQYLENRVAAKDFFFTDRLISNHTFKSANTIYLSGMTLTRLTREYMHILGQRLESGALIRIIILDSDDTVMNELALRSYGETTSEYWKNRLNTVRTLIDVISKTQRNSGTLELGFLPYIPSFGFTIIDPDDELHGLCYVEIYHHKSTESNPCFVLSASKDSHWFKFFCNQFEILWKSCRIETISK